MRGKRAGFTELHKSKFEYIGDKLWRDGGVLLCWIILLFVPQGSFGPQLLTVYERGEVERRMEQKSKVERAGIVLPTESAKITRRMCGSVQTRNRLSLFRPSTPSDQLSHRCLVNSHGIAKFKRSRATHGAERNYNNLWLFNKI